MYNRNEIIEQLTAADLDVLVVGGGIVGAGVARDAAMRGLRVGLVEQYDLAFGTSSRSTRLLHGGLRYLAQGHIGLVYESSHEKKIVHGIAPHLSRPLPIIFPTYRRTQWPFWKLRIGVKIYDLLCGGRNLGPSYGLSPGEALAARARTESVRSYRCGAIFRFAEQRRPAGDRYASLGRRAWGDGCQLSAFGNGRFRQKRLGMSVARYVYRSNASEFSPARWSMPADRGRRRFRNSSVRLRLTKGVHLVIDRQRLDVPDAVMVTEGRAHAVCHPLGRAEHTGQHRHRLRRSVGRRAHRAGRRSIRARHNKSIFSRGETYCRPTFSAPGPACARLIASGRGGPSDISRAHQIRMPKPGWIDVAGGKLTTYRLIGEQVVDRVVKHLGKKTPPCRTAEEPLVNV